MGPARLGRVTDLATDPRAARYLRTEARLRVPMLVLALALLPVLLLPALVTNLSAEARHALDIAGVVIWGAFFAEYLTLLAIAPDRRAFVRSHVPDLVLICVPFLRPLRALRLVRALRVGMVLGAAVHHGSHSVARRGLTWTVAVVVLLLGSLSVVVVEVERGAEGANITNLGDALWWSLTTATTVGYGDRFPVTNAGRAVGAVVMLSGIALLGVVTASIAAWFVKADTEDETASELRGLREELAALREALGLASPPTVQGDQQVSRALLLPEQLPDHERSG